MVLYPDDPTHVACMEKLEQGGYSYCSILHTEDVYDHDDAPAPDKVGQLKKAHWHVVLVLKNPRFRDPLAEELGIKANYLEVCRNRDGALLYLIHDGYPNKYQYDPEQCQGSLAQAVLKLLADDTESARVLRVLDVLDSLPVPTTYRTLLVRCCQLDLYGDFRRMGSGILRLLDEHNNAFYISERENDRNYAEMQRMRLLVDKVDPFEAVQRIDRQGALNNVKNI